VVALVQHAPLDEAVYEGAGIGVQKAGDVDGPATQEIALGPPGAAAQLLAVGARVVAPDSLQALVGRPYEPCRVAVLPRKLLDPHLAGRLLQEFAGFAGAEISW
jgi:hypothetical protein